MKLMLVIAPGPLSLCLLSIDLSLLANIALGYPSKPRLFGNFEELT